MISTCPPNHLAHRDTRSYFGVLLDFNDQKAEERIPIEKVTDLYLHSERILETIDYYEKLSTSKE